MGGTRHRITGAEAERRGGQGTEMKGAKRGGRHLSKVGRTLKRPLLWPYISIKESLQFTLSWIANCGLVTKEMLQRFGLRVGTAYHTRHPNSVPVRNQRHGGPLSERGPKCGCLAWLRAFN